MPIKYPKVTLEQSCFFDVTSKKVIFEMMLDLMSRTYGEDKVGDEFLALLEKANNDGEIQSEEQKDVPNAIKKARNLKKQVDAIKETKRNEN